jgi:hypothetical protein
MGQRARRAVSGRSSLGQSDTLDAPHHPAQSPLHRSTWASGKARHKPDQIATIVQPLIIDWPVAGSIGRARDQEDWAARRHLERLGRNSVDRGRFQFVFSLDQRRIVLVLQQCTLLHGSAAGRSQPPHPLSYEANVLRPPKLETQSENNGCVSARKVRRDDQKPKTRYSPFGKPSR